MEDAPVAIAAGVGTHLLSTQARKLARVSAYLIAVVGAVALHMALAQLTMGVAWTLLIGGAALLIGAIMTLRVRRQAAPTRPFWRRSEPG